MLDTITASTFFEQTFPTFLYLYIQSDKITDYYQTPYYMLQHLCGEKLTPTIWKHFKYNHIPQDLWFLKVSTEFSPFYSECLSHKNFYLSGMQNVLYSLSLLDSFEAPVAEGWLSSSPTHHTNSHRDNCMPPAADDDADRLIINGFRYSVMTRALLQELHRDQCRSLLISMTNFIHVVKCVVSHWQYEMSSNFSLQ